MTTIIRRRSFAPTSAATAQARAVIGKAVLFTTSPFSNAEWTPAFVAFMVYIFAMTTGRWAIGGVTMSIALATLAWERTPLRFPPIVGLVVALIGWAFLGLFLTDFPEEVSEALSEFWKIGAIVFVMVNVITTRVRLRFFVVATLIAYCIYPVRGTLLNFFIGGETLQGRAIWNGVYSNPNDLGALSLLQMSIGLGILAVEGKWWVKWGTRIAVSLLILVIVLTQSRGALIALVGFGIVFGRKHARDVKKILSVVVLLIGVAAVTPDSAWKRFSTIQTAGSNDASLVNPGESDFATRSDQSSSVQRRAIWRVAMAVIADNGALGVGLGGYPMAHFLMAKKPTFDPIAGGRRDAHSTVLRMVAETGIVGLVLFGAIIVVALKAARRARKLMQDKEPALALQVFNLEAGLYGFLIAGIWGSYGAMVHTYIFLTLIYVSATLLEKEALGAGVRLPRRGGLPVAGRAATGYRGARA